MFSKDCILRLARMCSNSGLPNWLVVAVVDKGRQKLPVLHMRSIMFICFCNTASSFAGFLSHHTTTKWIISVNALSKRAEVQIHFGKAACGLSSDYFILVVTWAEPAVTKMKVESFSFLPCLKWRHEAGYCPSADLGRVLWFCCHAQMSALRLDVRVTYPVNSSKKELCFLTYSFPSF